MYAPTAAPRALPARTRRLPWLLVAIGVVTAGVGLAVDPDRIWSNWLIGQTWLLGTALGAVFFVAIHYVTKAGWHTLIRRVPEAVGSTLPLVALLTVPLLLPPVLERLYPWAAPAGAGAAAHGHGHTMSPGKALWLSPGFFVLRVAGCFVVWWLLARGVFAASRRQDVDGAIAHTRRGIRFSAGFLVAGSITICLAAFDLLMSLTPHWFSTIFGVYYFAGSLLSALCVITLLVIGLRRERVLPQVRDDHLHNLGKLVFAFATFHAYIWFSQFMLVWYANLPEETTWFITRHANGWNVLFLAGLVLNWVVPFLVLLPRGTKRNDLVLGWTCVVVLAGRWLDHYLMVMPEKAPGGAVFGLPEIGMAMGFGGAFLLVALRAFERHAPVPARDPLLGESLSLHT